MSSIDKYIIRQATIAFILVLISLTGFIWITQALRQIDLMTDKSQSILIFLGISGLIVPPLVLVIAPIAWLISIMFVLNRLASESEIIVLSSAGLSPFRFLRPFLIATGVVSFCIAMMAFYVAPKAIQTFRAWQREIDADLVTSILKPGDFAKLGSLTINIQARLPGGVLTGVFIDDQRNPAERLTIISESGYVQKNEKSAFLILQNGNLQRAETAKTERSLVSFKSYAFDLSQFSNPFQTSPLSARERYIDELVSPPDDAVARALPQEFRAELHDRILVPIYPIIFALMAFAALAPPRTTRQTRNLEVAILIAAIMFVRFAGYAVASVSATKPEVIPFQYLLLAVFGAGSCIMIKTGTTIGIPKAISSWVNSLKDRLSGSAVS